MSQAPEAKDLDKATQIELRIVAAGARRDLGQADTAVVLLQGADLNPVQVEPWTARLRYAYAEALLEVGREDEAREWFTKAGEVDPDGLTDAGERLAELDGLTFSETEEEELDDEDLDDEEDEGDDELSDEDDEELEHTLSVLSDEDDEDDESEGPHADDHELELENDEEQ
jgi:hypothetical protein